MAAQTMTIEYDCGHKIDVPVAVPEDGTMIHQHGLVDTLVALADATHDTHHPECAA